MRFTAMLRWLGCALLLILPAGGLTASGVDYAQSRHVGLWLQHPVYGGPSFDAFVHSPQNPLHRGAPPFEWPVNSFFFADPVSGNWYIYVGDYPVGYAGRPCRCVLLRSTDRGQSWTNLGVVLEGSKDLFDQGGSTPDVSIVYAEGRYHMVYDWVEPDWSQLGGLGYAWADKPEGPFHRAPQPITLNRQLTPLLGKYRRTYAATLLRRKHDWMIVAMMDAAPSSWALFGFTAPNPEGPYGERVLLRNVESDGFHPPLMEFYPSFAHRGFVYAPATSVALNRNYNALFRAPLERAADPGAWQLVQNGSLWHSDDVENEAFGMWGQTFSGGVDHQGMLRASFHSRDPNGMGTVNVASRPWNQPLRKSGFVMSGHQGPSLTLLRRAFAGFRLEARLRLRGTVRLLLDYDGVLGPNLPQSDATLHPLALSRCDAVELSESQWKVIRFGQSGEQTVLASGERPGQGTFPAERTRTINVRLERMPGGTTSLTLDDRALWSGEFPSVRKSAARPSLDTAASGPDGAWAGSSTTRVADIVTPFDTAPRIDLSRCTITRPKGENNPAQGNALGIADGCAQALKARYSGAQTEAFEDELTNAERKCIAPSGLGIMCQRYSQGDALGCTIPALQADSTASSTLDDPALQAGSIASNRSRLKCSPHVSTAVQHPSLAVPVGNAGAGGSRLLGIWIGPHSHLEVERFSIQGKPQPAAVNYLYTEAILGAGGSQNDWQELRGPEFRYGIAAVSKTQAARLKWNVEGRQLTLWSPRGPAFGKAQVKVDGRVLANLDLRAERLMPSTPAWKSARLRKGFHAVVVTATEGPLPVDSLEAAD